MVVYVNAVIIFVSNKNMQWLYMSMQKSSLISRDHEMKSYAHLGCRDRKREKLGSKRNILVEPWAPSSGGSRNFV